jgi:hypothetical protein
LTTLLLLLLFFFFNKNNNNKIKHISLYILCIYNIVSTPLIKIIEDNSEPADECDMSFLNDVLEQYNRNLHQQGLRTRMFEKEMCAHEEALRVFHSIKTSFY